jgi:hypothetical protein
VVPAGGDGLEHEGGAVGEEEERGG